MPSGGSAGDIQHHSSIKVGIDPVTARWRSDTELWMVNHISDTISVVDRLSKTVTKTLVTNRLQDPGSGLLEGDPNGDEPADVVFNAGDTKAYVSCSRTDYIQVWDLATYSLDSEIYIDGEDPRVMDIHNKELYTAIFESGNGTTLLFGESAGNAASTAMPPNTAVLNFNSRTDHPYYWDGAGVAGYEVNAIYPPPKTGEKAADFALATLVHTTRPTARWTSPRSIRPTPRVMKVSTAPARGT